MSTEDLETSEAEGEPLELYRFSYGTGVGNVMAYTDADFEITYDGVLYAPAAALEREAVNASEGLDKSELEVSIDQASEVAQLFLAEPPGGVVGLTIFRCHWDPAAQAITQPVAIWVGRVLSGSREGHIAALRCEPAVTSLRRVGLRRHYQYMCPHVLYGPACGASRGLHTNTTTTVSVTPRAMTVSGLIDDQYYGGIAAWQPPGEPQEHRTILGITRDNTTGTSVLMLAGGTRALEAGMSVDLAKGCKHTLADCRDVFDNAPNFGGQPYIPGQNPHGTTSIYN